MRAFDYIRASDIDSARQAGGVPETRFLAGGTTLLDLMKCGVERPARLVDISHLQALDRITVDNQKIYIGASAKMNQVAANNRIQTEAPVLSEALWRAASPQLRNMASIGGNLLQPRGVPIFGTQRLILRVTNAIPVRVAQRWTGSIETMQCLA